MTAMLLGKFRIDDEIARFPPGETHAGRRAETLIKTEGLRVVLVTMRAGAMLHDHTAPGPITIQALRGRLTVVVGEVEHALGAGDLMAVGAGARHRVQAIEDGAFLLTIAWRGRAGEGPLPSGADQ